MSLATRELTLSDPGWSAFVSACDGALPFHHPRWAELLAECYGYRAFALAVTDPRGEIVGGVPAIEVRRPFGSQRYVSLPFTDYCPLLSAASQVTAAARALIAAAASDPARLEVRGALPAVEGVHTTVHGVRHTLELGDGVEQRVSKHHRRNLRRAEQSDLTVRFGTSVAEMAAFYRLHLLTRQRQGVPVQPWRFFKLLARTLQREQLGFVLTVYRADVAIAAAVFMTWRDVMLYKYGASDARFWELRPNNLLFWQAIRRGCERGLRLFDWGRTEFGNRGLREYKSGWGAHEEQLVYSVIADRPPGPSSAHIERVLTPIIRRSPVWVGRAIGEVLYRYAA